MRNSHKGPMPQPMLLYYDGLCQLCSREIAFFRKRAAPGTFDFVDIANPEFAAAAHGVDPIRVQKVMHVKKGDELLTGLEGL